MITNTIEPAKHVHAKNKAINQCLAGANAEIKVIENSNEPAERETSTLSRLYPISRFRLYASNNSSVTSRLAASNESSPSNMASPKLSKFRRCFIPKLSHHRLMVHRTLG